MQRGQRSGARGGAPNGEVVSPGRSDAEVVGADGRRRAVPAGWALVPPGDAALTRRVKAGGAHWVVQERRGRRTFSRGVYADAARVAEIRAALAAEREDPAYARRLEAGRARRAREQEAYAEDFEGAVRAFLRFDARHRDDEARLARAVAAHAVPVGSGTVARTRRIPIEERAEAALIAWMRHQTTGYDQLAIPRVRGRRREVRRMLAERSRQLLRRYRRGEPIEVDCPLQRALRGVDAQPPRERELRPVVPREPGSQRSGGRRGNDRRVDDRRAVGERVDDRLADDRRAGVRATARGAREPDRRSRARSAEAGERAEAKPERRKVLRKIAVKKRKKRRRVARPDESPRDGAD